MTYEQAWLECERQAIEEGALEPQGFKEGLSANWLQNQGRRFADTPLARSRLQAWTEECMRRKGLIR